MALVGLKPGIHLCGCCLGQAWGQWLNFRTWDGRGCRALSECHSEGLLLVCGSGVPNGTGSVPSLLLISLLSLCRLPYAGYFGGVSGLSKSQFLKINGFPNEYWGWGGEDDDIFNR